jgi:hypothetical protein
MTNCHSPIPRIPRNENRRGIGIPNYHNPNIFSFSSGDDSSCDEDNRNNRNDNGNGVDDEGKTFLKHSIARVNLNNSEVFLTSTTEATK